MLASKIVKKVVYKNFEKQRAEMFKHISYFLFSIIGMAVVRMCFFGDDLSGYLGLGLILGIIIMTSAYLLLGVSFNILRNLDIDLSEYKE